VAVEVVSTGGSAAPSLIGTRRPYVPPHCPNRVPTAEGVEHLEPLVVHDLIQKKACTLIDLRSEDRAAGLIEGAMHIPAIGQRTFLSRIDELAKEWAARPLIIFTCQYSAHRAPQCANWYRQKASPQQRVAILSGGFRGWEAQGLPVKPHSDESCADADEVAMQLGTQFVQVVHAHPGFTTLQAYAVPVANGHGARQAPRTVIAHSQQASAAITAAPAGAGVSRSATPQSSLQPVPPAGASSHAGRSPAQPSQPSTPVKVGHHAPQHHRASLQQQPPRQIQLQHYQLQQPPKRVHMPPPCPNRVPTIPGVDHLDPPAVHDLMRRGKCVVVDLRGEDRAAGLIEGAVHVPAIDKVPFLTRVPELVNRWSSEELVIFTCQYSAHRAPQCANWYREQASHSQQVAILSGGFRQWEAMGLPVKQVTCSVADAQAADEKALQLGSQLLQSVSTQRAAQTNGHCDEAREGMIPGRVDDS